LLLTLADGSTGLVDLTHALPAANWCRYFESHARAIENNPGDAFIGFDPDGRSSSFVFRRLKFLSKRVLESIALKA